MLQELALKEAVRNNEKSKGPHTSPNPEHYPNGYLWDSNFAAIVYAELGEPDRGAQEVETVLSWQNKKSGFIPNMKLGYGRNLDIEKYTFTNPGHESNYSQPPFHARAAMTVYKSYVESGQKTKGERFLKDNYESLALAYKYFIDGRQNSESDPLIGIIHPHETGRDSDPTFDFIKKRLPTMPGKTPKVISLANTVFDYGSALKLNVDLMKVNWNIKRIREEGIFWVNDVMFNVAYAENLRYMSEIAEIVGNKGGVEFFGQKADDVAQKIIGEMWDEKNQMFYATDIDGAPIKKISISNITPIMLPGIKNEQLSRILDLLDNKDWFNTPYPIPSVPAKSPNFDPHYDEKRLWRGPVWMNTNWMIVEALFMQAEKPGVKGTKLAERCMNRAFEICEKSIELAKEHGFWEFYDAINGQGLRINHFTWSTLAGVIEKRYLEKKTA